jgi:hypothetical protein
MVEQQIQQLRAPRKKRRPGNPVDAILIVADGMLLLVILGIVAFYVLQSYIGVAATRMAALGAATVAPTAGPFYYAAVRR